jgi:hypothetical protein
MKKRDSSQFWRFSVQDRVPSALLLVRVPDSIISWGEGKNRSHLDPESRETGNSQTCSFEGPGGKKGEVSQELF